MTDKHESMSEEQTTARDVGRAIVRRKLHAKKGELEWAKLPRLQPIAQARPWTLGEMLVAFAFTGGLTFVGFLIALGARDFWHHLKG